MKRCEQKLGRVIQMFKDNNGLVQSAKDKITHNEIKRPVVNQKTIA